LFSYSNDSLKRDKPWRRFHFDFFRSFFQSKNGEALTKWSETTLQDTKDFEPHFNKSLFKKKKKDDDRETFFQGSRV